MTSTTATLSPSVGAQPATTATASTTVVNPYRQQELYDQHHGITKKPAPADAPLAPNRGGTAGRTRQAERESRTAESAPVRQPERAAPTSAELSASNVRIGLRGGITYPYYLETDDIFDPAVSFVGGVVFNIGNGTLSFQPEINYARYASKVSQLGISFKQAIDQLEVPLFLKLSTGNANSNRFFVNVGPYASYALNLSINGKTESLKGVEGRFGFGGAVGLGAALKAGPGHVTLEARGLYSLGNSVDGFNTDSQTIFSQATLGYVFPLGGR